IQKEVNPMKYSVLDVLLSFDRLAVGNIELETGTKQRETAAGRFEHNGVKLINPFELAKDI
ncbi:hypothetical protein ACTHSF_14315, partial [Neisseria sp. P0001.S010]|uniref:hypothetical protein n=1 Tax=Neisseria sp. P0001.S010 TaxID=3436654 RepID=UPI003F823CEA